MPAAEDNFYDIESKDLLYQFLLSLSTIAHLDDYSMPSIDNYIKEFEKSRIAFSRRYIEEHLPDEDMTEEQWARLREIEEEAKAEIKSIEQKQAKEKKK